MIARLPWSFRIGLALILTGIVWFGGWSWWEATRIWVPLDIPISLSAGHIRTPEFAVNVESAYEIDIQVERAFDFWGVPCLIGGDQCHGDPGVFRVSWTLSSGGRAIANGGSKRGDKNVDYGATLGRVVGEFGVTRGNYVLDLDVLGVGDILNRGTPHLLVSEAGYEHWAAIISRAAVLRMCLFLAAMGTFLIVRSVHKRRRESWAALSRNWLTQPGPQPRNLRMGQAPSAVLERLQPPASTGVGAILLLAGLAASCCVWRWSTPYSSESAIFTDFTSVFFWVCVVCIGAGAVLLAMGGTGRFRVAPPPVAPGVGIARGHIQRKRRPPKPRLLSGLPHFGLITTVTLVPVWMVLMVVYSSRWVPKGLPVHLLRLGITAPRNPGIQPVLVQVSRSDRRSDLYMNGRPVAWKDLAAVLQKELNQRPPDWPVYVEGDPEMDWLWAAKVVDIIQGLHGKAYLLTGAPPKPR